MSLISTKNLMKLHLIFSAFMLPIAMLFLITGVIYFIFEYDGMYINNKYEIALSEPVSHDLEAMSSLVAPELESLGYPVPENGWKDIVELDEAPFFQFEWHDGLDRIIILKSSNQPEAGTLFVNEANFFKKMMLLHLAYGDIIFRIYAIIFSTMLFCMFITGYIIAWRMPQQRNLVISTSLLSIILFLGIVAVQ